MSNTQIVNPVALGQHLHALLNAEMLKAAEPLLQEALKRVEVQMRQRLAELLIAQIDRDFDIRTHGNNLTITVNQAMRL